MICTKKLYIRLKKTVQNFGSYQFDVKFIHLFVSGLLASFEYHYPLFKMKPKIEAVKCIKWQANNNNVAF